MLEETVKRGIAAMLPVYNGGNVTKIITADGQEIIDRKTCRTVLRNIAQIYNVDLSAIRRHYRKPLNKKLGVPIPLSMDILLIPIKFRKKPLGANDGTLGYVNLGQIQGVMPEGRTTSLINLKSGVVIRSLVSRNTVLEYIKNARLVKNLYINKHFDVEGEHRLFQHFVKEMGDRYNTILLGARLLQYIDKMIKTRAE